MQPLPPGGGGAGKQRKSAMASLGELERAVMDLLWAGQEAATANTLRDRLAQTSAGQDGAAGHWLDDGECFRGRRGSHRADG